MGKSQRDKGARVERDIIALLNMVFGTDIKRQLDQTREGGLDTTEGLPFSIEIKARKASPGVQKFLDQAIVAVRPDTHPIAIIKADNKPPIVTLTLADFVLIALPYVRHWEAKKE